VDRGPVHPAHHDAPPWSVDDGAGHVAGSHDNIGAILQCSQERVDGLDRDRQVRVEEDDRIAGRDSDTRADGAALPTVGQLEPAIPQLRAGELVDRRRVRGRGVVRRSVVSDDDLRREAARTEVFGAASEARR